MVQIPDLVDKTYRQAVPILKAIGLEEGNLPSCRHGQGWLHARHRYRQ